MRKIILLIPFYFLLSSCDIKGGESELTLEILPISEVNMPTAFARDSITEIPVKYIRPTSCHFFDSFYYAKNGFERTVAIYAGRPTRGNCQTDNATIIAVPLRFKRTEIGTYHFKFWFGENSGGADQFIEYDVVVDH